MDTIEEKCVALLHDVLEDSDCTASIFQSEGLPSDVINGVVTLTKPIGMPYMGYIENIARQPNKTPRKVKMADLRDNMNVLRLGSISGKDVKRLEKYHKAYMYLNYIGD